MEIFPLPDKSIPESTFFNDYKVKYQRSIIPIVIDNGSYNCRAGWGDEVTSRLQFRPQVAKVRSKKESEPPSVLVGNDIKETEISKLNPRTQFDQNVVYHFETQESILDHIFQHLGIDSHYVANPVLMTEPICNPSYCRSGMSELLFECYGVPSVCYGVDAIFAHYANNYDNEKGFPADALIVSSAHSSTHVLPIVGNQFIANKCKRLSVGGLAATEYLRKLIHLKYPLHRNAITTARSQYLKEEHCYMAANYVEELAKFSGTQSIIDLTRIVQLPYTPQVAPPKVDQERKNQLRKEQGQRLKEMADRKRREKRAEQEERLACLLEIKSMQSTSHTDDFWNLLEAEGLSGEEELNMTITELEEALGKPLSIPQLPDDQLYPLIDTPDDQLTEEQIKEKRRQKFIKNMRDGRVAAKKKKEEMQQQMEREKQAEDEKYNQNPQQYLSDLHSRRQALLTKREQRQKQQAAAGTGGRRSRGRANVKVLAMRDADETKKSGSKRKLEDTFGERDEDWNVYLDTSEAVKEEEEAQLTHIEGLLAKYDADFAAVLVGDSSGAAPVDEQTMHQLHLGVERIRVPEIIYQPQAILGIEQMGLAEIIQSILSTFEEKTQHSLATNIFFTGGNTLYSGFEDRLTNEVRMLRPFGSKFKVIKSKDPMLDSWLGMARWFQTNPDEFKKVVVTKADYDERGGDYFKPYFASNVPLL